VRRLTTLSSGLRKYDSGCTKNTLSGNRFSAAAQPIP